MPQLVPWYWVRIDNERPSNTSICHLPLIISHFLKMVLNDFMFWSFGDVT
jgi:hypothetical protein